MRLKIITPDTQVVDRDARKVIAEAPNGSFCLLPRHIDFVAALVPGILIYETPENQEVFLAVDEGLLVKCGDDVRVAVANAVEASELARLRETVEERFKEIDEHERRAMKAVSKIEAGFVRRFLEIQRYGE
jgi:F-type H+-transporting ATPase subunit epsilon